MLLHEATHALFPSKPALLRHRASRAFAHGEARSVCENFAKTNGGIKDLTTDPLEPELTEVAAAFVQLQEARHRADYDLAEIFDRVQVVGYVDQARQAIATWKAIRNTPNANVFLTALLLNNRWNKFNK
jgi:hypothetical protein